MSIGSQTIVVKPREGVRVRDPRTRQHISADKGTKVPKDAFWLRRLKAGDVVEAASETEE